MRPFILHYLILVLFIFASPQLMAYKSDHLPSGLIGLPPELAKYISINNTNSGNSKYWGVNLRFKNDFPNSATDLQTLTQHFKSLGINHTRIVGLDFDEVRLFAEWSRTGKLNEATMKRFCDLTTSLRAADIHYTVDLNHISSKFNHVSGFKQNGFKQAWKKFKFTQLIDPKIIKATKQWYESVLNYKSGGCNVALSEDPYLTYLNIVNEDSLFNEWDNQFSRVADDLLDWMSKDICNYTQCKGKSTLFMTLDAETKNSYLLLKEKEYFTELKSHLRKTCGYTGPITLTNNWYGNSHLKNEIESSDATNMHIYFDHPIQKTVLGKGIYMIDGGSLTVVPSAVNSWPFNNLYRLNYSSIAGKPIIISEWGHSNWSDYSHQGPLVMYAYAAQHGAENLNYHTYMPSDSTFSDLRTKSPFSLVRNPSHAALFPALSFAFRNELIKPATKIYSRYLDTDVSLRFMKDFSQGKQNKGKRHINNFVANYIHKYEVQPDSNDTINMEWQEKYFKISGDTFIGITSNEGVSDVTINNHRITLSASGSLVMVPLDLNKINESKMLLIALTGGQIDPLIDKSDIGIKEIIDVSSVKSLNKSVKAKSVKAEMLFCSERSGTLKLTPVMTNSTCDSDIVNPTGKTTVGCKNTYSIKMCSESPWYLLEVTK